MGHWQVKLISVSALLGILIYQGSVLLASVWNSSYYALTIIMAPVIGLICLATIACLHIITLEPPDSHSLRSLLQQYIFYLAAFIGGPICHRMTVKKLNKYRVIQENTLMDILKKNGDTMYGKDYDLKSIKSREDFVSKHPLTSYSHYQKYVEKVANGEGNILTKAKVEFLALSSGTTGKNKMYPRTRAGNIKTMFAFLASMYGMRDLNSKLKLKRIMQFAIHHPPSTSPGGIQMGGLGQFFAKDMCYGVVPVLFKSIYKESASFYVQGVFALREEEIALFESYSSDLCLAFFRFIENNIEDICDDISLGVIRKIPDLEESIRLELNQYLTPKPGRAEQIRKIFHTGSLGTALKLWPKICYTTMCKTGSFVHSAELLTQSYLSGLKISFRLHGASEGMFGICLECDPESNLLTFITDVCFLEFIPVSEIDKEQPTCLFMDQVEVGQCYELVVTNYDGLYRNRFGDVIKIMKQDKGFPSYIFQYRTGQILNIAFDRTPESILYKALEITEKQWPDWSVTDYTSVESSFIEKLAGRQFDPARYVVFIEINSNTHLGEQHKTMLEDNLCDVHEAYKDFRLQGSIAPMEVIQVKPGSFEGVRAILMGNRSNVQFKMPRVMRKEEVLAYLWGNQA